MRSLGYAPEFLDLVNLHRGDISADAMIREMQTAGLIRIDEGRVFPVGDRFVPLIPDRGVLDHFIREIGALYQTHDCGPSVSPAGNTADGCRLRSAGCEITNNPSEGRSGAG